MQRVIIQLENQFLLMVQFLMKVIFNIIYDHIYSKNSFIQYL